MMLLADSKITNSLKDMDLSVEVKTPFKRWYEPEAAEAGSQSEGEHEDQEQPGGSGAHQDGVRSPFRLRYLHQFVGGTTRRKRSAPGWSSKPFPITISPPICWRKGNSAMDPSSRERFFLIKVSKK